MDEDRPLRLVVLGDSTSFTGERGALFPNNPSLYPNVAAAAITRELGRPVSVTVLAEPGGSIRDVWKTLTKNQHVQFEVLRGADAVIVGVSSFDHAPCGVPPVVEVVVPFLRPGGLRRRVRVALRAIHPYGVMATGSRVSRMGLAEFLRVYDAVLLQVRGLARGAAGVVMGPTSHNSRYYGWAHPKRVERERRQFEVAARHGFATVPCWPQVEPHRDHLNVDGVHWPAAAHKAVGEALARPLIAQLRGEEPGPVLLPKVEWPLEDEGGVQQEEVECAPRQNAVPRKTRRSRAV